MISAWLDELSTRFSRRKVLLSAAIGAGLAASVLAPQISYELEVSKLNLGLGRKVAFLPDLHYHWPGENHVERAVDEVRRQEPDILVIGGDLVDEETRDLNGLHTVLSYLEAGEKLAVLGNHEYWSKKAEYVASALKRNGFKLLSDEFHTTKIGRIFGYDWRENRRYPRVAVEGVVVAHDPNSADSVSGAGLVLAGHTHGGFTFGSFTLFSNSKYHRGLYRLGEGLALYVSRGLGQMLHQIRVNAKPELVILE